LITSLDASKIGASFSTVSLGTEEGLETLMRVFVAIVASTSLIIGGCSACMRGAHAPLLAEDQVVRIANDAARQAGYDLSKWQTPQAHFEFASKNCGWSVFYEASDNTMPGHFTVYVNDRTKRVDIAGGL
jgi:hypothetical protein